MLSDQILWSLKHGIPFAAFPLKPPYLSPFFISIRSFWRLYITWDFCKQQGDSYYKPTEMMMQCHSCWCGQTQEFKSQWSCLIVLENLNQTLDISEQFDERQVNVYGYSRMFCIFKVVFLIACECSDRTYVRMLQGPSHCFFWAETWLQTWGMKKCKVIQCALQVQRCYLIMNSWQFHKVTSFRSATRQRQLKWSVFDYVWVVYLSLFVVFKGSDLI